jgi:hypothetical protein
MPAGMLSFVSEQRRISHLSNSQINELLACSYRWYLRRVAGVDIPEVPAWWLLGGTTVHTVAEKWERQRDG